MRVSLRVSLCVCIIERACLPAPPGQIGSLQATQMSHETTIRDLDQEQSRLKETMSRLEGEREALLNQSQADDDAHCQQVVKLEQVGGAACLTSGVECPLPVWGYPLPAVTVHVRSGVPTSGWE